MHYFTMEKKQQPPAVKIQRLTFEQAEEERNRENKKGNPYAMSSLSWFTFLIKMGLVWFKEHKKGE